MGKALRAAWSGGKDSAWAPQRLRGALQFSAAAVNNLFDERYYTYAVRSNFTPDRYSLYPLPGRTLSFAAELKLD